MAITAGTSYVNSSAVAALSGTVTMTTVDANSLVLVTVATDDNATPNVISAPTATGLTFVQIGSTIRNANDFNLAVFRAYTTTGLGSTLISCSWTQSNDWLMGATDYLGTAGTLGNNGSDAIGTSTASTPAVQTTQTVTVNSSAHDNSKYFGAAAGGHGTDASFVKGANYTINVPNTWDGTWANFATELSTNPVLPAANTAVNFSSASQGSGVIGVELLVAGPPLARPVHSMGPSYRI